MVKAAPDLELVHPAGVGGGEIRPQRSECDLLADDDEVRLVAIVELLGDAAQERSFATQRRILPAGQCLARDPTGKIVRSYETSQSSDRAR